MSGGKALAITGVAPHSLGEVFLTRYLASHAGARVIGLDRVSNVQLEEVDGYFGLKIDLNPLKQPGDLEAFGAGLQQALVGVLDEIGANGVEVLIQSAGVYDFGRFLEHDLGRRRRIIGVNFIGHLEVLFGVMAVNKARGVNSAEALTYIDVGSFQGLYARAQRSLYAPSKAVGIDLCTALWEGKEVHRCIYFAPAAIDTHMLHRNHWVTKAGGSEEFFDKVFRGGRKLYREIFIECNEDAVRAATAEFASSRAEIVAAFEKYRVARQEAFRKDLGVLPPEDCGEMLIKMLVEPERYPCGVYLASGCPEGQPTLEWVGFDELSRLDSFKRKAQEIPWK